MIAKNAVLLPLCVLVLSACAAAPSVTPKKGKIESFYTAFFNSLESRYLHRDDVEWETIRAKILSQALAAESLEAAQPFASDAFDAIGCNHCQLFAEEGFFGSTLNKSLGQDDFSMPFLLEYQKQPGFGVKRIDDDVGYILIPGMLLIDLTPEQLNLETQKMYDQIAQLMTNHEITGWIVDLRFNIGGNVYPMLAALHPLLGDSIVYKTVNLAGDVVETHALKNGGFYTGEKLETIAIVSTKADTQTPVALITSKMTGSAGENIAVAFRGRRNTVFIGEETFGFLTANDLVELPFSAKMAFTTSFIADAKGIYRASIVPDIRVSKKDNFDDLTLDGNVIHALEFIRQN